jgi:polyisoprenoid-binding protein YceI
MAISNVKGVFTSVKGSLTLDSGELSKSHVEAVIDANSIETRDTGRDTHLKSIDFLDADKFPALTFHSRSIPLTRPGQLEVEGDLTIRGVTQTVTFEVEGPTAPEKDPWGNLRVAALATTKISRKDFGLVWNAALESGGILVGDEVSITLDVEFVRASS